MSRQTLIVNVLTLFAASMVAAGASAQSVTSNIAGYITLNLAAGESMTFPNTDIVLREPTIRPGGTSDTLHTGGDETNTVPIEMVALSLRSIDPITFNGQMQYVVRDKGSRDDVGTFQTEMISMSLTSTAPLPGGELLMLQLDPSVESLGSLTVEDIGSGLYRVDRFFDIFTEISIDGGNNWEPSNGSTRFNAVPEPASMAMALLGLGGLLIARRRRG